MEEFSMIEEERLTLTKAVLILFKHWQLTEEDKATLLGLNTVSQLEELKAGGLPGTAEIDKRIGLLLAIHRNLRLLYPADKNRSLVYEWVKRYRMQSGRTALDVMKESMAGIEVVCRHLQRETHDFIIT